MGAIGSGDGMKDLLGAVEAPHMKERATAALAVAYDAAQFDGGHHKMWVIDQMVRALLGDSYSAWVAEYRAGEDGTETYEWDEGIAP